MSIRLLVFLLCVWWATPSWGAIYFSDDCNDTTGTAIESHTPDVGTGWTQIVESAGGQWEIDTNMCEPRFNGVTEGAFYSAAGTYSTANYTVQVDLAAWPNTSTAANAIIGCRYENNGGTDGYVVFIYDAPGFDPDVVLYRSDDGALTSLGTANTGPVATDQILLECNGDQIGVKKNGSYIINPVTDGTYSNAGTALMGGGDVLGITNGGHSANYSLDNFVVTSIDPSGNTRRRTF